MDNITQGVIGGSLFTLITRKQSNKNFLKGAVITNIGDFDVIIGQIIPFSSPLNKFFFHRSIMHSIVFALVSAFIIGGVVRYFDTKATRSFRRSSIACFVAMLGGHLLIDGMTSYGIRYRLPWSEKSYTTNTIFIIDFGIRIIVIGGFVSYLLTKLKRAKTKISLRILLLCGGYFAMSGLLQARADDAFHRNYPHRDSQGITVVEPLQVFLWKHIIKSQDGYLIGYYSIFDHTTDIDWQEYPQLQQDLDDYWHIVTTQSLYDDHAKIFNFTQGNMRIIKDGNTFHIQNMTSGPLIGRDPNSREHGLLGFQLQEKNGIWQFSAYTEEQESTFSKQTRNSLWTRVRGK